MPLESAFKGIASLVKAGRSLAASSQSSAKKSAAVGLPIAIDFGSGGLKVLQVAAGEPLTLVGASYAPVPEPLRTDPIRRLEFQAEALAGFVKDGGYRNRRAVCSIPAWATVCKHMQLNKADGPDLREQVLAQIPLQLHCDPSTIVHRFLDVTPPGSTRPEVIVMAVSRELVTRLMRAITDAKLQPVGMHSEFLAAIAAYDHIHRRAEDIAVNTMYVDLGATMTTVSIAHGRTLAFVRTIDIGGAVLDQAIMAAKGCTLAEARRLRDEVTPVGAMTMAERADPRRTGEFEERRVGRPAPGLAAPVDTHAKLVFGGVDLSEPVGMLADEVRMCMRFHATQFPQHKVDRVIFLGGESRHAAICARIASAVRLAWHTADPFARVSRTGQERVRGVDFAAPQPGWAVALGLCLSPTDL